MPVANFFGRAALAASQAASGLEPAALAGMLEGRVITLAFDGAAAGSAEGRMALELGMNLLARLYPTLAIAPLDGAAQALADELGGIAQSVNPDIDLRAGLRGSDVVLAAGSTSVETDAPIVYIGSSGWVVRVSPDAPVGSGRSQNPYGAGAAACFGAANVFRIAFAEHLTQGTIVDSFAMSLLDLAPDAPDPADPEIAPVDLGESFLVGVGAIGNAVVWALGRTPGLTGELHLVDHEAIDLTNLQRYVLAGQRDIERPKVDVGAEALSRSRLRPRKHRQRWGDYLGERDNWLLERVAVAVDTPEDRVAVQAALPRWIANAWTQPGDLGVSRHDFADEHACLACLYLPEGEVPSRDAVVAEAIGLSGELMLVRQLLYTGQGIDRALLGRVAAAKGVLVERLLPYEGQPLQVFYQRAVCGEMLLGRQGADSASARNVAVPLAFQSALAGILLAAELVAHAGGMRKSPPPTKTALDLVRPLGRYLSLPVPKHPSGRCLCQDTDYVERYRAKYGVR